MSKAKSLVMRILMIILGLALVWYFVSNNNKSYTQGELVDTATYKEILNDKTSDGKRIMLKATLAPFNTIVVTGETTSVDFNTKDNQSLVSLKLERGKNGYHLPTRYDSEDIKVIDNDGNEHLCGNEVLISFTMKLKGEEPKPLADVTGRLYSWDYEEVRIDPVK